jgi:hypothetical protein
VDVDGSRGLGFDPPLGLVHLLARACRQLGEREVGQNGRWFGAIRRVHSRVCHVQLIACSGTRLGRGRLG